MENYAEWDAAYLGQVSLPGQCCTVVVQDIIAAQPGKNLVDALAYFDQWAASRGCAVFELTPDFSVLGRRYAN